MAAERAGGAGPPAGDAFEGLVLDEDCVRAADASEPSTRARVPAARRRTQAPRTRALALGRAAGGVVLQQGTTAGVASVAVSRGRCHGGHRERREDGP